MEKSLLDHKLRVRLPITIFVVVASFTLTYYFSYAERNNVGYGPSQPIAFSHKLHAGDMNIDCKYCHVGADQGRHATVPSTDICMGCHAVARLDKPEIQKLSQYYETGKLIPWNRVHETRDFAYFNHSVHVNKGIDCSECHGTVQQMEVITQVEPLTMGACLECHRTAPQRFAQLAVKQGPEDCGACHR